ncbi:sulfotransferase 1A1-like [Penaeus japonicus]|uniref:sulfotransferase 1A1-like n=1 Tax=Penaeus japonicus TaxID=27405 RepID=UPI001C711305|nr:sulfotransferase 1A1-like [Penaeus japonicus]
MASKTSESGHELVEVSRPELERLERHFTPWANGLLRLRPGGWLFPGAFTETADKIYNFGWKEDDVLVTGFLKTGTTWLQEILWTMRNHSNLDHPLANTPILDRVPIIDTDMFINPKGFRSVTPSHPLKPMLDDFKKKCPDGDATQGIYIQMAGVLPEPRTLKTHYPFSVLHPDLLEHTKCVYVARNPRDVVVSLHHMCRLFEYNNYSGTLEQFVDYFVNGDVIQGPYWLHVKEAWEKRNHPNLHFIFYEDLKSDTMKELRRLNDFLGTNLTAEQLDNVKCYTSFGEMQSRNNFTNTKRPDNPGVKKEIEKSDGGFFRKGVTGSWSNTLTPSMVEKIDEWTRKYLSEIPFRYK